MSVPIWRSLRDRGFDAIVFQLLRNWSVEHDEGAGGTGEEEAGIIECAHAGTGAGVDNVSYEMRRGMRSFGSTASEFGVD